MWDVFGFHFCSVNGSPKCDSLAVYHMTHWHPPSALIVITTVIALLSMRFTDWVEVRHIAVGSRFARITNYIRGAIGWRKEWHMNDQWFAKVSVVSYCARCERVGEPTLMRDPFALTACGQGQAVVTLIIVAVETRIALTHCILCSCAGRCCPLVVSWKGQRERLWKCVLC